MGLLTHNFFEKEEKIDRPAPSHCRPASQCCTCSASPGQESVFRNQQYFRLIPPSTFQNQWVKTLTASVQRLFASSMVTSTAVTTYKYQLKMGFPEKSAANSPGPHTLCSPWPRSCTQPCSSAARSGCQRTPPSPATTWPSPTRLSRPVNMRTLDFDLYFLKKETTHRTLEG